MRFSAYEPGNIEDIKQLFTATFSASEGASEGKLIGHLAYDLLRNTNGNDLYGFVASENEQIIGCIIFSRLTFEHKVNAFLLSPVAIRTKHQGKGIGQKLINFGLHALKVNGVELVFTYGDPNFYSKIGFSIIEETIIKAPRPLSYPEGWLGQSLVTKDMKPIIGQSYCVEALNKPELW